MNLSRSILPYSSFGPPLRGILLLVLVAGNSIFAQEDSAASDEEDVFELPAFTVDVSGDSGYRATNSISGSVISVPTRDLPFTLSVVNADFIEDLQASDLQEALQYSSGVFTQTYENTAGSNSSFQDFSPSANARANDSFADRVTIRGYPVPNQQRNGFRIGAIVPAYGIVLGGSTDTAAVERFEVVKGPSSLLYGISVLSGVVNLIPKRPLDEPRYEASVTVGNYGFFRTTGDATGPIIKDKLSYRLIGAYQANEDWTDYHALERSFASLQFDWDILERVNLYVDFSHAVRREEGMGASFFQDGGARGSFSTAQTLQGSNNAEYVRNEYGEFFTWGLDFGPDDAAIFLDPADDREYSFPDLGYGYRISGPDTFREQNEFNATALLTVTPTEHLRFEFGLYYSEMKEKNRLVDMASVTGGEGAALWTDKYFKQNSEYDEGRLGEAFPVPTVPGSDTLDAYDIKFARYYWYESPVTSDSVQLRGRGLYSFERDIFGLQARHNFIAGYSFIEDEVSFISDSSGAETLDQQTNHIYTRTRLDEDPYILRNIFDYSPIRYDGEALAMVGDLLPVRNVTDDDGNSVDLTYLRLSGHKNVKLWYRGMYAIYHGEFWNGRATFIGGIRGDSYQVREREKIRLLDRSFSNNTTPELSDVKPFTDVYNGSGILALPYLIGDGTTAYEANPALPDEYHELVREEYRLYQQAYPNGTVEYNFDKAQQYVTKSGGLSVRLTDVISTYVSYSEGIFPNTGLRDGNYKPIAAEETQSAEVGFKFEWDTRIGRFSGDIAFYQMKRKNAVTYWSYAPNPGRWYGGADPVDRSVSPSRFFDPQAARGDLTDSDYLSASPVSYGVAIDYLLNAAEQNGIVIPGRFPPSVPAVRSVGNGFETLVGSGTVNAGSGESETYYYFNYTDIVANEVVKAAFDAAIIDQGYSKLGLNPIDWTGGPDPEMKNNPSNPASLGSFVTYEEEETGIDFSLFYEPTPNYQIVLGISMFDREIVGRGFDLVTPSDAQEGDITATEYDQWVYILGVDAFDDPTDPTSMNGKGINGTDLAFVPHLSATLWNKYRFTEGLLDGFELGGGVVYSGPTPTSTTIGGSDLQINQYRTPDLPERYIFDAHMGYEFEWMDVTWNLSLRVGNVFDKRSSGAIKAYEDEDGNEVLRRSFTLLSPRTFRLNLSATF